MINNIWQKSVCYGCSDAHHRWLHLRGRRHPGFSTHSFLIFWVPELHSTTSVKLTWNIIQDGGWTGVSPDQEGIHTSCRGSLPRSWASMAFTTSGILFAAPSLLSIPLGDISEQNELTLKWENTAGQKTRHEARMLFLRDYSVIWRSRIALDRARVNPKSCKVLAFLVLVLEIPMDCIFSATLDDSEEHHKFTDFSSLGSSLLFWK